MDFACPYRICALLKERRPGRSANCIHENALGKRPTCNARQTYIKLNSLISLQRERERERERERAGISFHETEQVLLM